MNKQEPFRPFFERVLPWLVLAILLTYSYAKFFQHPYGFSWDSNGVVDKVFLSHPAPTLNVGDHLVQVGSLSWQAFHANLRKTFFEGVKQGDVVPVEVERNGQTLTVQWKLPGMNRGEVQDQLLSEWPVAYFFWFAGTLTLMFLRPKDERWWLLSAFDFLTALWLESGGGASNFHIWYSALVLRVIIWLSVPVYLHLHWVFPRPLGKLNPILAKSVYAAFVGLAAAQWFQLFSSSLYFLAFLLAVVGSLILLVIHFFRQAEARREVRLFAVLVFYAFLPTIIMGVISAFYGASARLDSLALVSFAAIPFAYLYSAYRPQLGGLEIRVNRIVSAYLFLILLGIIGLPLLAMADRALPSSDGTLILGSLSALAATVLAIWVFPHFQDLVERRLFGVSLPSKHLQEIYSARITTSASLSDLLKVINDEIIPSLLVRQFIFFRFDNGSHTPLLSIGMKDQIPDGNDMVDFVLTGESNAMQPAKIGSRWAWVRLALPLKIEDEVLGFWLFGRRDPDDAYSQAEIPILQALANQTAIALSNILQTERLKSLYGADINRYEEERLRLALDLHDNVLNQMATLQMNMDESARTLRFQEAYNGLTQRLREIVSDLRPPMLLYGLKPAIEALADNMMERSNDTMDITVDIQAENQRYSQELEQHIFRIVQEACQNALKHSGAKRISISGRLEAQRIQLSVEDNGAGFDAGEKPDLKNLLANKHFGLAGMIERAEMIQAEIKIASTNGTGTRVRITWNSDAPIENM